MVNQTLYNILGKSVVVQLKLRSVGGYEKKLFKSGKVILYVCGMVSEGSLHAYVEFG